ncbi:MAG: hypothetical protein QOE54_5661 [Streptosporangiaceae bacterium]|nr:hypothetical protein [Streptosporangiaceae bacterium]
MIYLNLNGARGWVLAAPLIALYSAADFTGRLRVLTLGWLAVVSLGAFHLLHRPSLFFTWENFSVLVAGGLAVAAGDAARSRRAYVAVVEERARRAERDRDLEAERRVTEEHLRIARDLHDVLGHRVPLENRVRGASLHVQAAR